jgi:hypothetical protein
MATDLAGWHQHSSGFPWVCDAPMANKGIGKGQKFHYYRYIVTICDKYSGLPESYPQAGMG